MDDMTILMMVAAVLTTIAFVMMYRDGKEQKKILEEQERAEAEEQAKAESEPAEVKPRKKHRR